MSPQKLDKVLKTWQSLNADLIEMDEKACTRLLNRELNGQARPLFIKRIHSRLNKVRAHSERARLKI